MGAMSPLIRFFTTIGPCLATIVPREMRPFLAHRGGRVARTATSERKLNGNGTERKETVNGTEPNWKRYFCTNLHKVVAWIPPTSIDSNR